MATQTTRTNSNRVGDLELSRASGREAARHEEKAAHTTGAERDFHLRHAVDARACEAQFAAWAAAA